MKIDQINALDPVATTTKAAQPPARTKDKVSLANSEELEKAITNARLASGAGRTAQLNALEAQIRNGTFQPSPSRIAEKLLSSAETDAQLLALLKR